MHHLGIGLPELELANDNTQQPVAAGAGHRERLLPSGRVARGMSNCLAKPLLEACVGTEADRTPRKLVGIRSPRSAVRFFEGNEHPVSAARRWARPRDG